MSEIQDPDNRKLYVIERQDYHTGEWRKPLKHAGPLSEGYARLALESHRRDTYGVKWRMLEVEAPKIIGLVGAAGAGKNTVAQIIAELCTGRVVEVGFADAVKRACKQIYGFSDEQLWGSKKDDVDPRYGEAPRKAMQLLGTEGCRAFCDDVWVQTGLGTAKLLLLGGREYSPTTGIRDASDRNTPDVVAITDVRFPNEVDAIREAGGVVVRVDRRDAPGAGSHSSESSLADLKPEFAIGNDGSLDDLQRAVWDCLRAMGHDVVPAEDKPVGVRQTAPAGSLTEYQDWVSTLMGAGENDRASYALGLAGESGKVCDILKKHWGHGKMLDEDHLQEELGDVLWYVAAIANQFEFDLSLIAEKNVAKLEKRHAERDAGEKPFAEKP